MGSFLGKQNCKKGAKLIFEQLQSPTETKMLVERLVEEMILLLYPEIESNKSKQ